MRIGRAIYIAIGAALFLQGEVRAATLAQFSFTTDLLSSDTDPNSTATLTTPISLHLNGTDAASNQIVLQAGLMALSVTSSATTYAAAVAGGQYLEFTLTPASGFRLDLTGISVDALRQGSNARGFGARSSVDGFVADIYPGGQNAGMNTYTTFGQSLAIPAYQAVTSPLTFRVYVYNAPNANQRIFLRNLIVTGDVVPVPEPATAALVALGMMALALSRRRA